MSIPQIPPDVAAYLLKAASEIAEEQGFHPCSIAETKAWLTSNAATIAQRASDIMANLGNLLLDDADPEPLRAIREHIGNRVYRILNQQKPTNTN